MKKAKELVYEYALAGYTKIHLDTSMRLADDPEILDTAVIARRGVELYSECMKALEVLKKEDPDFVMPVFIIGSEVPIPGGATDVEDGLAVTSVKDFENTISTYKQAFEEQCILDWEENVIAVVGGSSIGEGDGRVLEHRQFAIAVGAVIEMISRYLCTSINNQFTIRANTDIVPFNLRNAAQRNL